MKRCFWMIALAIYLLNFGAVCGLAETDVEEAVSVCKTYDDYERFTSEMKSLLQNPDLKNADMVYYAIGRARLAQVSSLAKSNTVEAGRQYLAVGDQYYNEALEYLDKSAASTRSKDLILDVYVLKFLILRERVEPKRAEAVFNEIINRISQYSDNAASKRRALQRVSDKFIALGLADYAFRTKTAYASKVGGQAGQEIFEDIRKSADQYFAKGDMKEAARLYQEYISRGQDYFTKDDFAPKVMEIAERYYAQARYGDARRYYEFYTEHYSDSKVMDYASYRIALSFYYEKEYDKSIAELERFMTEYQGSVWFDKAFEVLSKLYYVNFPKMKAIEGLKELIDKHYRKNVGDYAQLLIGLLYYGEKDYKNALTWLNKINATSIYFYAADTLIKDIEAVKKGKMPTFSFGSRDTYRSWESHTPLNVDLTASDAASGREWADISYTESGILQLNVKKSSKIQFTLKGPVEDLDRFTEYFQDKEDISRLPKELKEDIERDLLYIVWNSEGGSLLDEKEGRTKVWQAPDEPGTYKVSVRIDDLGLVRMPDKGLRKDSAKELSVTIVVKD